MVLQLGAAIGDACSRLERNTCAVFQVCDVSNTCAPITVVDEGACSVDVDVGPVCRGSFFGARRCDTAADSSIGVCADVPARGGDCTSDRRCALEDTCVFADDFESATCIAAPVAGDLCDSDDACGGLSCEAGVCAGRDDLVEGFVAGSCDSDLF